MALRVSLEHYLKLMAQVIDQTERRVLRGATVPAAEWGQAAREDGTFKSADELQQLYGSKGITKDKKTITYCRIGERSSHTWFVLKYLLGFPNVRNYDGSWTEWGNLVDAPVVREAETVS
ncbi:MAG: sulfurtransferase [Acidobacteriota bacterium]